ncbi:trigger factor [Lentibacter algarum]|uniref:DUF6314 family protein n=1 Tax=Lentibacter algarum TaxID=576131 RepID=UPI001C06BD2F|nr:DUF6314 family protein [Lentibacter algarum]MBU2980820.1 trigger factor [Lentibacter algarum]
MTEPQTSPHPVERHLGEFEGLWRLNRRIKPANGPEGQFDGRAEWVRKDTGLAYVEQGVLTLEGQPPMQAERRYFWDAELNVYFEDGRFFHQVPRLGGATAHWCDPDQYNVSYDFASWPVFEVCWKVRGPRKDYEMITRYVRN